MSIEAMAWAWTVQGVPANGKLLLLAIADHADPTGGNAFPSHDTLARKTGYSTRQVKRIIDALVSADLMTVGKATLPGRRHDRQPNLYRLCMSTGIAVSRDEWSTGTCPPDLRREVIEAYCETCALCHRQGGVLDPDGKPWEVDRIVPGRQGGRYDYDNLRLSCQGCNRRGDMMSPRSDDDGGTSQVVTGGHPDVHDGTPVSPEPSMNHPEEPSSDNTSENCTRTEPFETAGPEPAWRPVDDGQPSMRRSERWTDEHEPTFDKFWSAYPRHADRPDTLRAFIAACRVANVFDIGRGLKAWKEHWADRNEPDFIPYPATWLRAQSWNDPPPPCRRPTRVGVIEHTRDMLAAINGTPQAERGMVADMTPRALTP